MRWCWWVFTVKRSLEIHRSRTFIICHSVNYSPLSTYCNVPTLQTGADTVCKTPFRLVHVLLNIWQDVIGGATRAQPADRPPAALLLHSQREADCSVRARWASGGTEVNVERSRLFRFLHHHHLQQHTARGWRSEATAARQKHEEKAKAETKRGSSAATWAGSLSSSVWPWQPQHFLRARQAEGRWACATWTPWRTDRSESTDHRQHEERRAASFTFDFVFVSLQLLDVTPVLWVRV